MNPKRIILSFVVLGLSACNSTQTGSSASTQSQVSSSFSSPETILPSFACQTPNCESDFKTTSAETHAEDIKSPLPEVKIENLNADPTLDCGNVDLSGKWKTPDGEADEIQKSGESYEGKSALSPENTIIFQLKLDPKTCIVIRTSDSDQVGYFRVSQYLSKESVRSFLLTSCVDPNCVGMETEHAVQMVESP